MDRQPGAYIEKDGSLEPDLNDEAMAKRHKAEDKKQKTKKEEVKEDAVIK